MLVDFPRRLGIFESGPAYLEVMSQGQPKPFCGCRSVFFIQKGQRLQRGVTVEDARKTYRFNPYLAIYDSPAWHGTICDSRVWSWIVFNVNIGEETITLESGHPVAPGEVFTTYSEIAEEISWVEGRGLRTPSKSTISDTLDRLESMGLVNVLRTDGGTYIQVCEILKRFHHKRR